LGATLLLAGRKRSSSNHTTVLWIHRLCLGDRSSSFCLLTDWMLISTNGSTVHWCLGILASYAVTWKFTSAPTVPSWRGSSLPQPYCCLHCSYCRAVAANAYAMIRSWPRAVRTLDAFCVSRRRLFSRVLHSCLDLSNFLWAKPRGLLN